MAIATLLCFLTCLSLLMLGPSAPVSAADRDIVAPGAKLTLLVGGFAFAEGPACDRSDQRRNAQSQ